MNNLSFDDEAMRSALDNISMDCVSVFSEEECNLFPDLDAFAVKRSPLPDDFYPGNYCVICGRGKDCFNAVGNRRFRVIVSMFLERYSKTGTKTQKSRIVSEVVDVVRSSGGVFCKLEKGRWWDIGDITAR
jgi:hypothetical protein